MSKTLNTNSITNELENSSFFPSATRQPRSVGNEISQQAPPTPAASSGRMTPQPAPTPTTPITTVHSKPAVASQAATKPTPSRHYVRRTFDFFDDQIAYLTKTSLEEKLAGGEGSMNAMVREALDDFIKKRSKR